ncbi:endo-1,4-beta-xylanase 5-like [Salvia miltiorrhiza]|uniref:endo-1,4-beta-xylanase 5-like n=1 Tax=Salvia miltiorrhiza TaxID=226208 RepID=UPI0025AD477A|nr:endo-1,4-beta-xylanase 5-like [Salvia miltiorrhiza]
MANHLNYCFFVIFILIHVIGFQVYAVPYDYSYTAECLEKPLIPQYSGGIVVNPELNEGLKGWTSFGNAKVEHAEANDGNKYIVSTARNLSDQSLSQHFDLDKDKLYTFSAWLQVSNGSADIAAVFKTANGSITAGWVSAQEGCWSMLKGGLVVDVSGPAQLYFQCNNTGIDIRADSVSLQPFTHEEWKSHQDVSIEKARKTRVRLLAVDQQNQPIRNATVSISLQQSHFPLGCAINQNILGNGAYQNWFSSRFRYTVFENELKWYSNERSWGVEDYSVSDALMQFARSRGIAVRGHNIFWENPAFQPSWVPGLNYNDLSFAVNRRINSVTRKYRGQLLHWDVMNENLHYNFFESRLGSSASVDNYLRANRDDPKAIPFLNEYNTIEESGDGVSSPGKYLQMMRGLRKRGYKGPLGIGVQGHFRFANLPYTRSAIDILATEGSPIWVTELDVKSGGNQAGDLDQILRELHSHGAVKGIVIWSAWSPQGCYAMCLTDNNFRNLATGDVVDRFRNQFAAKVSGTTDSDGFFETSLFHGEYEVKITHPNINAHTNISHVKTITLAPDQQNPTLYRFNIHV